MRLSLLGVLLIAVSSAAAADPTYTRDVEPFLKQYCIGCHGAETQEARIRYDNITGFEIQQRHLWTKVHEMLSSGEMPPEDETQPDAAAKQRVLQWIQRQSAEAKKTLGTGSLRRLNRRELSAALQDVTGLAVNYADALPGDGKVAGFDTGAEGLQDAADSVSQVMTITRRAVDGIYFLEQPAGPTFFADLRNVKDVRKAFDPWKAMGANAKPRGQARPDVGMFIDPKWVGERGSLDLTVPAARRGVLRLRVVVAAVKNMPELPNPHLWVEIGAKKIDFREITASLDSPVELIYEVQLEDVAVQSKGVKVSLANKIEIPYGIKGFENEDKTKPEEKIPGGPGLFRPKYDRKKTPLEKMPVPFVVLQEIEIQPNHTTAWPPQQWTETKGIQVRDDKASAAKLLGLWMERAYRRPVGKNEAKRFEDLYTRLRGQGFTFDDAMRATFQSVLLSSPFRYLASPADADKVIAQHAIASRLSFMLTGSPPDAPLRRLAAEGKLRDPKVLDAEVDRLLSDPRSAEFVQPFVTQWLEMEQPITIVMDYFSQQHFRFGRYLKDSMRQETFAYVSQLLQENRPARELIHSDWTMMNNSLAVHYGYKDIEGGHLRKVKLRKEDPRGGGILSHAGIQSMLCWMGENWVIYRGAWALRHILDDPPPAPPLEVPELTPSDGENRGKTFRELLKQHQEDSKCSVCHRKMDPLGFAFQNFDISGRWRKVEHERYQRNELDGKIEWRGTGKTRPVDTMGQLPRGEEYASYAECKQLIVKHYMPDLVRGVLKNLFLYGTGRQPDVDDMLEIRAILARQEKRGYPMRDLVKEVVRSKAFLNH